ncbi:ABC transporter permease [Variovorax ureilyticus]|jgi:putative xylitol transport system permease protein|uniref:ABC transporter permease n=1 Tax=Variovorax ureilyticus TaxID=1836198 RepID=A0ABU8VPI5_9BURK
MVTQAFPLGKLPRYSSIFPNVRSFGIVGVFILVCVVFALSNEYFMTIDNWRNLLRQSSINAILAIGVTFVILAGGIDLSVGSVMALCGMVSATFATSATMHSGLLAGTIQAGSILQSTGIAVTAGILAGALLGGINGFLVARFSLPAFVATLGMLSMARGMTLIYSDGRPIPNLSSSFLWFGGGDLSGIPVPVLILAIVFVAAYASMKYTAWGRYIFAVGGSTKAARTCGVSTRLITASTYVVCGALAGLAGVILTARTTAALPQAGAGYELDAIAAVVIGGASLNGGRGSLVGTLVGALIIGTINNGMDLVGVNSYYQQLVKGLITILAVALDRARS